MTPERAAFLGAIVGGIFTLAGSILTGLLSAWTQWLQTSQHLKIERKKNLAEKRLLALQNCVQMIDFLIAAKNTQLGDAGSSRWLQIRMENVANGAFFPSPLHEDFAKIIQKVLMLDSLEKSAEELDYSLLVRLREGCVAYIEKEF
ncbi:MAG TPA: hypothetical protein VHY30_08940 [Verrucomicrobiae bacterium]|jgi:hypothetical protein|nr:hypothetical protein [Verrucomicrobiae bacterium]